MAQAFVTTYLTEYRWNSQPKTLPIIQENLNKLELKGDIWITDFGIACDEKSSNYEMVKEEIQKQHLKRMNTTYQRAYCKLHKIPKSRSGQHEEPATAKEESEEEENNELLEYCKHLYDRERENQKILPPLKGARTVFGYLRPSRMRGPYSVYQADYGKIGYNVLKSHLPGYSENKRKNTC